MMSDLAAKHCVPCETGMPPMSKSDAEALLAQVDGWQLVDGKLARQLKFKDFAQAMAFVNKMATIAEEEGHHPDFCVSWNRVKIELVTHNIGGLSENDFILAAKINRLEGGG
jgi:4a-hydroxytetrahydrobiopterin dehydratase